MKKVLIVDWLDKYAGSERVITSLDNVFDFDECYSLVNIMNEDDLNILFNAKKIAIRTTALQKFGKRFRILLPLFPFFSKKLRIPNDVDIIISSSHAIAKSITNKKALHISYFQARNLKYIWEEKEIYFTGIKSVFKIFIPYLQNFDLRSSQFPNYIISNSKFVQKWVQETYSRESIVIYPPVNIDMFTLCEEKDNYYVTVGRLEPYKRFDILVKAFNLNKKKLIIIGDGSQMTYLKELSEPNIEFLGYLNQKLINQYISKAKGFVFTGLEDFGIAPVEAQACGTPVICLGKGGTKETVIDGVTGVHFQKQTITDLLEAIKRFEEEYSDFDAKKIREHALKFSKERFEREIEAFVNEKYELFKNERED